MTSTLEDVTPEQYQEHRDGPALKRHNSMGRRSYGDKRRASSSMRLLARLFHAPTARPTVLASVLAWIALATIATGLSLLVDLFQRLAVLYLDLELQHLDLMKLYIQATSIPLP